MASITGREGSLLERALAIHEADIIVAPHGGQCFNLVFARPGTIFVEILPGMSAMSACVHVLSPSRVLPHLHSMLSRIQGRRKRTQTHVGFVFLSIYLYLYICVCIYINIDVYIYMAGLKTSDGPYSVRSFASGLGLAMWVLHVRSAESTLLLSLRDTSVPVLDLGRVSA